MYKYLLTLLSCFAIAGSALASDVSSVIANLDTEDYELRKAARSDLLSSIAESSGADRAAIIVQLHESMTAGNSFATRDWSIRILELFGEEPSVLLLAQLLKDPDPRIRDLARLALQANPSEAATRVLENALLGVPLEQKGAILDAIAYRQDQGSVAAITALLESESYALAVKAALALGKIAGEDAISALLKKHDSASEALKLAIELALLDAGLSDASVAKTLTVDGKSSAVKLGAFQQLIQMDAESAKVFALAALSDESYPARNQIIRIALNSSIQDEIITQLPSVPPATQKIFLGVISDLRLSQYEAEVLSLLQSGSPEVKADASIVLGVIGSDQSYSTLYNIYLTDPKDNTIKAALTTLNAPAADSALLKLAANASSVAEQIAAIELLTLRNPKGAIDLVNRLASVTTDLNLKKALYKSMELIGNVDSIDLLLASVLKLDEGTRAAQGSLKKLTVSLASNESLWEISYAPALKSASSDEARKAVLAILDGVACRPAAKYLEDLIVSDSSVKADALRSLARWPDISGGDVWLTYMSRPEASEGDVAEALKGINRLISQSQIDGGQIKQLELAAKAIKAAPSLGFKQSILDTCKKMRIHSKSKASLRKLFKPFVNDPEIGAAVRSIIK